MNVVVYEIVASEELPVFDATIKVKHVVLPRRTRQIFNALMWRYKTRLLPSYIFGQLVRVTSIFAPAAVGRWIAFTSPLLQAPMVIVALMSFRYEYLKVLATAFDFWFFSVASMICFACLVLVFQDARVALLPVCWLELENAAAMDAFFNNFAPVIIACMSTLLMIVPWAAVISLGLISEMHDVAIVVSARHRVMISDVVANTMGTLAILLVRLIYRRHTLAHRDWGERFQTVQSMGYRCKVKLQPLPNAHGPVQSILPPLATTTQVVPLTRPPAESPRSLPDDRTLSVVTQRRTLAKQLAMRFVKIPVVFRSDAIVFPWMLNWVLPTTTIPMMVLYTVGVVCPILTLRVGIAGDAATPSQRSFADAMAIVTLTSTVLFCGQFLCVCQTQLLRMLCQSFDFLFLSFQLTLAHLGACDLFGWKWQHCSVLLSSWIWVHWVMTLDALTPAVRAKMRFRVHLAVPVLLLRLVLQLLLIGEVMAWNEVGVRDRVLYKGRVASRDVTLYLLPFVASRVVTNMIWCAKLLWRIRRCASPDELIMLQGNVAYDCERSAPRRRSTLSKAISRLQRSLSTGATRNKSAVAPRKLDASRGHK